MSIHPTFNVELNHKERRDGTHNILIRVTKERKNRRIATELNIRKKDFNKKAKFGNWVRATELRNDYYNKTLSSRINQYQEKHTAFLGKGKHLTLDEFVAQITSHHSPSFISFYKQEISRYEKIGKYRTAEKHQFILNKLERYLKEKHSRTDINFDEMNTSFLTDYETYLKHDLGNHQNTYYTDLKNIRTIYRNAIRQEVLEQATYPFFKFPLRQIKSSKEKLTLAEIESIRRIPLAEGKAMWHARNCFLFSYYCAGMRWGDVCTLKWSNVTDDNRLHYTMSKNKKQVDIEIPELAVEILKLYKKPDVTDSDYVFPLLKGWKDYSNPKTLLKAISSKNTVID
jgi:integrase